MKLVKDQESLLAQLPVEAYVEHVQGDKMLPEPDQAFAVSVFDAWLGKARYHELDCDEAEQARRNEQHNNFCHLLRENYEVFAIRWSEVGEPAVPILYEFSSEAEFQKFTDAHDIERSGSDFFILAVPALGCIYDQNWDDTNVLWFSPQTGTRCLEELISRAGLHIIQY
ncbi:hypothetical protein BH09VER1_BH09VER1_48620 [soil metagenome]